MGEKPTAVQEHLEWRSTVATHRETLGAFYHERANEHMERLRPTPAAFQPFKNFMHDLVGIVVAFDELRFAAGLCDTNSISNKSLIRFGIHALLESLQAFSTITEQHPVWRVYESLRKDSGEDWISAFQAMGQPVSESVDFLTELGLIPPADLWNKKDPLTIWGRSFAPLIEYWFADGAILREGPSSLLEFDARHVIDRLVLEGIVGSTILYSRREDVRSRDETSTDNLENRMASVRAAYPLPADNPMLSKHWFTRVYGFFGMLFKLIDGIRAGIACMTDDPSSFQDWQHDSLAMCVARFVELWNAFLSDSDVGRVQRACRAFVDRHKSLDMGYGGPSTNFDRGLQLIREMVSALERWKLVARDDSGQLIQGSENVATWIAEIRQTMIAGAQAGAFNDMPTRLASVDFHDAMNHVMQEGMQAQEEAYPQAPEIQLIFGEDLLTLDEEEQIIVAALAETLDSDKPTTVKSIAERATLGVRTVSRRISALRKRFQCSVSISNLPKATAAE